MAKDISHPGRWFYFSCNNLAFIILYMTMNTCTHIYLWCLMLTYSSMWPMSCMCSVYVCRFQQAEASNSEKFSYIPFGAGTSHTHTTHSSKLPNHPLCGLLCRRPSSLHRRELCVRSDQDHLVCADPKVPIWAGEWPFPTRQLPDNDPYTH